MGIGGFPHKEHMSICSGAGNIDCSSYRESRGQSTQILGQQVPHGIGFKVRKQCDYKTFDNAFLDYLAPCCMMLGTGTFAGLSSWSFCDNVC